MEILFLLIPLSVLIVLFIAGIFLWSVKSGQYEDLERPSRDILMDDDGVQSRGRSGETDDGQ